MRKWDATWHLISVPDSLWRGAWHGVEVSLIMDMGRESDEDHVLHDSLAVL